MIEKITDQNLERYDSRLKEWCDRKFFEKGNYGKYQTTEEAGAVAFYPAPNTPLEGKVKFSFKETPPASGEKSPTNPSTIAGASNIGITRCGKNILPLPPVGTTTINQVSFTVSTDGSIIVNGTASADTDFILATKFSLSGKSTFFSGCPSSGSSSTYSLHVWVFNNNTLTFVSDDFGAGFFYNNTSGVIRQATVAIRIKKDYIANNLTFYPQVEFSTTATSFEPYSGVDYTLPLGSTYYGGTVDLATGIMTVTVYGEQIPYFSYVYNEYSNTIAFRTLLFYPTAPIADSYYGVSDRFEFSNNNTDVEHWRLEGGGDGNGCLFFINKSRLDISGAVDPSAPTHSEWVDAANAWLADTPVFLVYGVVTPQIIQLTPVQILALTQQDKYTPKLNTVYTDADSVQMSYLKSPIRDEYEKTQAILSLGGNS